MDYKRNRDSKTVGMDTEAARQRDRNHWNLMVTKRNNLIQQIEELGVKVESPHSWPILDLEKTLQMVKIMNS
ncbi:hypothetical protein D3C81_1904970 [compost metagenome]